VHGGSTSKGTGTGICITDMIADICVQVAVNGESTTDQRRKNNEDSNLLSNTTKSNKNKRTSTPVVMNFGTRQINEMDGEKRDGLIKVSKSSNLWSRVINNISTTSQLIVIGISFVILMSIPLSFLTTGNNSNTRTIEPIVVSGIISIESLLLPCRFVWIDWSSLSLSSTESTGNEKKTKSIDRTQVDRPQILILGGVYGSTGYHTRSDDPNVYYDGTGFSTNCTIIWADDHKSGYTFFPKVYTYETHRYIDHTETSERKKIIPRFFFQLNGENVLYLQNNETLLCLVLYYDELQCISNLNFEALMTDTTSTYSTTFDYNDIDETETYSPHVQKMAIRIHNFVYSLWYDDNDAIRQFFTDHRNYTVR
jgi:hypothetical protein